MTQDLSVRHPNSSWEPPETGGDGADPDPHGAGAGLSRCPRALHLATAARTPIRAVGRADGPGNHGAGLWPRRSPTGWRPAPAAGRGRWGRGRALRELGEPNVPQAPRVHVWAKGSGRRELPKLPHFLPLRATAALAPVSPRRPTGERGGAGWRDGAGCGAAAEPRPATRNDPSGAHGGHDTNLFCKLPVPTKISTLRNVLPI